MKRTQAEEPHAKIKSYLHGKSCKLEVIMCIFYEM
jgi:hypothetical protein